MKLSINEKKELREKIQNDLFFVPEGVRIELDNDELRLIDELIFDYIRLEDGRYVKIPVWTGSFLSKLDLSGLDFQNALLDLNFDLDELLADGIEDFEFEERIIDFFKKEDAFDFSNTNIRIDFSKLLSLNLTSCSFYGVDLSHSNIETLESLERVDLRKTGINYHELLKKIIENKDKYSVIDMDYEDLSGITINSKTALELADNGIFISESKLNIIMPKDRTRLAEYRELGSMIGEGYYDGCFINGKRISTISERSEKNKKLTLERKTRELKKEKAVEKLESKIKKLRK